MVRAVGVALVVLLPVAGGAGGRDVGLRPGSPAPAFTLERILQGPEGGISAWDDLKGRAVVLEFWATWCGPCLRLIPHKNQLVETFRDRPILFISVTDEDESTVTGFLAHREVRGWIGLDPGGALFEAYGVWSVPYAALIDASGVLRAVLHPAEIDVQTLEDLLAGRLSGERGTALRARPATTLILPSTDWEAVRRESRDGAVELRGHTLAEILAFAHGLGTKRIDMGPAPSDGRFDVLLPPGLGTTGLALLQKTLEAMIGFRTVSAREEREVYVLRRRPDEAVGFPALEPGRRVPATWVNGVLESDGFEGLARILEEELDRPVVDESGLKGSFLIRLRAERDQVGEVLGGHGLELAPARRTIEILRVEGLTGGVTGG
jgi:thiol-disulfide isomerase/thioredoxin